MWRVHHTSPSEWDITIKTIAYQNENINKNVWFELQLALRSELLLYKNIPLLLSNQIWEFITAVI